VKIKSLILGTLIGGLTALIWSTLSWEVIGWHEKSLRTFQSDEAVAALISSHTVENGTYLMPYGTSKEAQDRMQRGRLRLHTSGLSYARSVFFPRCGGTGCRDCRPAELELVGIFRRVHRGQPGG
jgi:hypothetical protein